MEVRVGVRVTLTLTHQRRRHCGHRVVSSGGRAQRPVQQQRKHRVLRARRSRHAEWDLRWARARGWVRWARCWWFVIIIAELLLLLLFLLLLLLLLLLL